MRIDDLINVDVSHEEIRLIAERCSQFIEESGGLPLLKNLPREYGDFHKVKVRLRKKRKQDTNLVSQSFNEAFNNKVPNLRERAVFANGEISFENADDVDLEPFYIFPIDGYQYMYSKEVENSSNDYKMAFDAIFEHIGEEKGFELVADMLKFTYTTTNLMEGILSGAEVIIYKIPYFYAIRAESIENYQHLITEINNLDEENVD